jgi:RNA polymerase sigma-70 factor (ECF subfamily)
MLPAMAQEPDDVSLMLRYRGGDLAAFEVLYGRHRGALFRYCMRQCRDRSAAEDLFQDVWARVVRARREYHPTAKFATYLYTIAHNCLVDRLRRLGRTGGPGAAYPDDAQEDPVDDAPGPEALALSREVGMRLRQALGRLPAEQREAFLLHEEAGLGIAEIGVVTGAGAETVKSRLRYALKKLRGALSDDEDA